TIFPSGPVRRRSSPSAFRIGTARGSPSLPSASIALPFAAKPSPASPATASRRRIMSPPRRPALARPTVGGEGGALPCAMLFFGEFRGGAVAADPREATVRDLALILGEERAPGIGLDRVFGLLHDVDLTI